MIAPGTVLQNRYVVERRIGEGGMGAVYVATDQRFGSTVALKETFFADPGLRRAFEREARLLNRLRHAALPRVSDHFNEGEGQFLVMEYIPGEDLSELLKRRRAPFPARDVMGWADQLIDALEYLHTQEPSVIHRDIKPQNLKLLPRNQIVLLDFGLAKGTPLQTRGSATGSVFGYSFNYAPIEQMQGAGTDPRSDLYSLGATLYHLLAGATPPDALARATAVLNGQPDPLRPAHELNPRVPAEVSAVLTRSMAQSAAARYGSAEEMRGALREAARHVSADDAADAGVAGVTAASEQATRLLGRDGSRPDATAGVQAGGTEALAADGGATARDTELMSWATASPSGAGGAETRADAAETNVAAAAGETNAAALASATRPASRAEEASVVTRVSAPRGTGAGGGSRSALAAGVTVAALAAVAFGVYSVASRGPETTPAPPAAVPQAVATPSPAAPAPAEAQQAAAPSPEAAQPAATPKPAAGRNARRRAAPSRDNADADEPDADADPEVEVVIPDRDLGIQPMSEAELREILRRAAEARRQAQRERERILREQQRRNRQRVPPAPPPQPQP